ncbi:hypothetical protein ABVK25_010841 [Lepraria finkii]|uniref:3'-5' exonuclease domain-containing protein n=1 Tax=Lepraria finkii TaxID=1340010 RepID=A0ABR4AW65_9LECA
MSSSTGRDETKWMENEARPSVGIPSPKTRQDRTWKPTQGICFGDASNRTWSPPNDIRFSPGPSPRMHSGDDARKLSTSTKRRISDTSRPSVIGDTSSERAYYVGRDELLAKASTFEAPEVQNLLHSELGTPRPVTELRQELESRLAESPRIRIVAPDNSFIRRVRTGPELPGNGSVSGASRAPTLSPGEVDLPTHPTSTAGPDQKVDSRSVQPEAQLPREMKIPLYPSVRQRTIKSTKTPIIGGNPSRALPSSSVSRSKRRMKDPIIISGYATVNTSFRAYEARRIQKVQQSLLDLMLEIDRLLRGVFTLPEMALKLRDLQNETGFHEDAPNGHFHSYRITRGFFDKLSSPRPGYKANWAICDLERCLIREPFCSFQESQNRLWRAIRSLVSFRIFRIRALGPDREQRSKKRALFRWIFKKWLLEHDEQLLAQVRPEGSSKPRAGAEQALGRVSEDHDRNPVSSGTLDHSSANGLNFQPSQQLAYPDLSTAGCLAEREPLYPVLDVSQSTCGIEDPGTIEKGRSPLGDNCGSLPPPEDAPFCTPLGFHIPKAKLQQAIDAEPTSVGAYWQYTLYQGPEGDKDKVKVHYCKSKDATERICQLFLDEEVIGFDIEWKMNASATDGVKKNVALVQVASEKRIALFHIARYPNAITVDDFVAPTFKRIMESPNVSKVGVSIKGDCTRLRKFMNIKSRGIFELSHLYKLVKFSSGDVKKINKVMVNLAQQVQEHLQLPLWKGELRLSDWSQDLNYQQIQYAASDSYAGFQLYHILESKRKALDPTPPRPAHAELNLPIRLANGQTVATYEEAPETAEESSVGAEPDLPIPTEELARDFLNIEVEDPSPKDSSLGPFAKATTKKQTKAHQLSKISSTSSAPAPPNSSSAPPVSNKPLHPNVIEANAWATRYMNSLPADRKPVAKPADLRAYHLWYHQGLEITQIASHLRDHPLAISTVAGYILRAIQAEYLPFPRNRVWALVPNVHRSFRVVYKAMIVNRLKEEERAKDNAALGDTGGVGRLKDGGSNEGGGGSQSSRA